jgi:hypothetical protein
MWLDEGWSRDAGRRSHESRDSRTGTVPAAVTMTSSEDAVMDLPVMRLLSLEERVELCSGAYRYTRIRSMQSSVGYIAGSVGLGGSG